MAKRDDNDESNLDRLAYEEIIKEAKRGKERSETMGPMGWIKCPLVPTNKRFFRNVVMGTLSNKKRDNTAKERNHQKARDQKIDNKKNKDEYERSRKHYNQSSQYSGEGSSRVQKNTMEKRKRSRKDESTTERHCRRDKRLKDTKSRTDLTKEGSYRSSCEGKDNVNVHAKLNQTRKHKLEEREHQYHKHTKKRKE